MTRIKKKCLYCGEEFTIPLSQIKRGRGKFCSKECYCKSRKVRKNCLFCGKEFEVNYNKRTRKYCSQKCFHKTQKGENNPAKRPEVREKISLFWKGRTRSKEEIEKSRLSRLGQKWSEERRAKCNHRGKNNSMYGKKQTESAKKKIGLKTSERCKDPIYKEKLIKAIMKGWQKKPNKPEQLLIKFLHQILPDEFKYVGDGQFILGGRCPDFLDINGKKKLIEIFGNYWHGKERTGIEPKENEENRTRYFRQFGFDTLIIWENELKDLDKVENRIIQFINI